MPQKPVITLLAYIVVLLPGMLLGYYFARTKRFSPQHKFVMTAVTIVNWVLILWLMLTSYTQGVLPNLASNLTQPQYLLPTLHAITGGLAQLLATYLVILMWTENTALSWILPYRIQNIKRPMRITLGLWLTTIALGVAIFAVWYALPTTGSSEQPTVTQEAVSDADPAATEAASDDDDAVATEAESDDDAVATEAESDNDAAAEAESDDDPAATEAAQ